MIGLLGPLGPENHAVCVYCWLEGADTGRIHLATEMSPTCTCVIVAFPVFVFQKLTHFFVIDGCPIRGFLGWKSASYRRAPTRFLKYKSVSCHLLTMCSLLTLLTFPIAAFCGQKRVLPWQEAFGNTTRSTVTRWTFWRLKTQKSAKHYVVVTRINPKITGSQVCVTHDK